MSIRSKIQALITAANAKTGESDTTLTDAVQTLVDGYGQGGPSQPTVSDYLNDNVHNYQDDSITFISSYRFYRSTAFSGYFRVSNCTKVDLYAFYLGGGFSSFFAPKASLGNSVFYGVSRSAVTMVLGSPNYAGDAFRHYTGTDVLTTIEFAIENPNTATERTIGNQAFKNVASLNTLIFRSNTPLVLSFEAVFDGTPFASSGSGGTIYIPKVLYDELGTGSALDYKAATNWSTIDSYGTITWAQIEGSIYETQYADGTPIPSE